MFKTLKKALFVALTGISFSAFAQETVLLDDVQVTANRYPQKQSQTGKTVTILSDSVLRANEGKTLGQLLQLQSGLQIVGTNQPYGSVQSIAMRGAGFGQTLILLDGVPVYEPSGIGNSFDITLLPIQNIERIEILKDGQSTIYGSEAMAGVINIISKKSSDKKVNLTAGISGGSYGTIQGDVAISGRVNKTGYQIGLNTLNSKGFSSAKGEKFEADKYNDFGFHAKIDQNLTDNLNANLFYKNQGYNTGLDEGAFTDDKDYTFKSGNTMWGGGLTYQNSTNRVVFNYLGSNIKRDFINDSTDVPFSAFSLYSENHYQSASNFFEVYSNTRLNNSFRLLTGLSHQFQNMDYSGFDISAFGRSDYDPIAKNLAKTNQTALYAVINGNSASGFGFEAGLRGNRHSTYGFNFSYNLNPYYLIAEKVKVFASMGSSYRSPALYQLYSPYGNTDLKPEKAQTYEVGVELFGRSQLDFIRVVGFERDYNDMIIFESIATAPWGKYNNLNQKNKQKGFEVEASKRWGSFSGNLNYTFLDGLISDNLKDNKDEIQGFLRRPKHTLNLGVSYSFNSKLNLGIQTQTSSKRNDTYFNSNTYATEAKILDAYTLLNLQANYKLNEQFTLHFSGQNLLNKDYVEVYGYNSRGTTLLGGLRVNF